tara:strand:+ start:74 stop:244 length:171 start_codon:yes stop_codon:yes gene_type:complete
MQPTKQDMEERMLASLLQPDEQINANTSFNTANDLSAIVPDRSDINKSIIPLVLLQ